MACSSAQSTFPGTRLNSRSAGGVSATRLGPNGPFIAHEMSVARPGDVLIENDRVRFYIAGGVDRDGYSPFAGWIEDAALQTGVGDAEYDGIDGFYPLVNQCPILADDVVIDSDGADGSARVSISGPLVAVPEALSVQGARPRPFDARVRLEYSLGPEDVALAIHTRVENVSLAAEIVDIGDLIVFGDDEAEAFTVPGGFDAASDLGAVDVVGSSHETRAVSLAVFGSGVPLTFIEGSTVAEQIGGDGALFGYTVAAGSLEPGATLEAERALSIGTDVGAALAPRWERLASTLGALYGEVTAAGAAVPGARVSLFSDAELTAWVTQAVSDEGGHFELAAPAGSYFALATGRTTGEWVDVPGVQRSLAEGHAPAAAVPVTLDAGGAFAQDLTLGPPARVTLDVRDENDRPVPAKLIFQAEGALPELNAAAGERAPQRGIGVRQLAWTPDGRADVAVEAGVYTITASHGPSAELDVRRGVELRAGESTALRFLVPRSVPREGYVAIDPHLHAVYSQHGEATRLERVITAAAEGLDVHVATDHDIIADYRLAVSEAGLDSQLLSIPGVELKTENGDHCAWPLVRNEDQLLGGARRWWTDGRNILEAYRYYADRGAIVMSVAHGTSHFRRAGYDIETGIASHPELLPFGFNAMELHNAGGDGGRPSLVPIWKSLISFGHRVAPLAASDAHGRVGVGVARTYVRIADGPSDATGVAQATAAMHTVASTGPFIELRDERGNGPGDTVAVSADGSIELSIGVWAPRWMPLSDVSLLAGGSAIEHWDASTAPPVQADPARAVWFEHHIRLRPTADEWYVVEVSGSQDLAPVYPGMRPWAMTAPLFVDVDGDGVIAHR